MTDFDSPRHYNIRHSAFFEDYLIHIWTTFRDIAYSVMLPSWWWIWVWLIFRRDRCLAVGLFASDELYRIICKWWVIQDYSQVMSYTGLFASDELYRIICKWWVIQDYLQVMSYTGLFASDELYRTICKWWVIQDYLQVMSYTGFIRQRSFHNEGGIPALAWWGRRTLETPSDSRCKGLFSTSSGCFSNYTPLALKCQNP